MQACQSEWISQGLLSAERHAKELVSFCPGCRGVSSMMRLALPPAPFTRIQLTAELCCQSVRAPESSLTCKRKTCQLHASVPLWQPHKS